MIITSPTRDVNDSIEFYSKLDFEIHNHGSDHFVSGKDMLIEINPVRTSRAGIRIYENEWADYVELLDQNLVMTPLDNGFCFGDGTGSLIYLERGEMPKHRVVSNASETMLGNFMGLSLEATDFKKTIETYQFLGFEIGSGNMDGGWIALQRNGFTISIMKPNMCPHLFFNPSLTFFNGKKNLDIIANIRAAGVPIEEEVTHFNKEGIVDNVILRDPGGFGFFIFND